jgi:ribosomal protein S1
MSSPYATKGWLTEGYDYQPPRRGQLRKGVILKFEARGITVDLGLKRDGLIPQADIERLEEGVVSALKPGQEVMTRIMQPGNQDSNHILS